MDLRIIDLLRINARRTLSDVATQVGLSGPAVKRRVDRLEEIGVIRGYTAIVDPVVLGESVEAFAELRFIGSAPVSVIESIAKSVPEVKALFTVAGDPDALAWIRARDVDHLMQVVDAIRRTGKVTGTKTLIVLGSRVRPGNATLA